LKLAVRVISWTSYARSELDAESVVSKLEFVAMALLLKFQVVVVGASP
jgi:hypothetical protein